MLRCLRLRHFYFNFFCPLLHLKQYFVIFFYFCDWAPYSNYFPNLKILAVLKLTRRKILIYDREKFYETER